MKTVNPLIVTPRPKRYESPLGFLLRVAEENGYKSPVDILYLAGLNDNQARSVRLPIDQLAPLFACKPSDLASIDYSDQAGGLKRYLSVHGHRINTRYVSVKHQKICVGCVEETGMIDAFWDLRHAVLCPYHNCRVTTTCPGCGLSLSWSRPGLLECKCGYRLSAASTANDSTLPESAFCLVAIIFDKFHRRPLDQAKMKRCGFPYQAMESMQMTTLLQIIDRLGRLAANGDYRNTHEALGTYNAVTATAGAFSNWPQGLYQYLDGLAGSGNDDVYQQFGLRKQFEGFYAAMFKSRLPPDEIQFIKDAFESYGRHHWRKQLFKHKSSDSNRSNVTRLGGISEVAQLMNVQPSTVREMVKHGMLQPIRINNGTSERLLFDLSQPLPKRTNIGYSLSPREAARQLGLPVSVLAALRKNGTFQMRFIGNKLGSYHSHDIKRFKNQMERILVQEKHTNRIDAQHTISLAEVIRQKNCAAESKASVIKAAMEGTLAVLEYADHDIQSAVFNKEDVESIVSESERRLAIGAKPKSAAGAIGCDTTIIPWLVDNGYLERSPLSKSMRITYESIELFNSQYLFCARLGKQLHTSSRKIINDCQGLGIPIYWAERRYRNSKQPFIEFKQLSRLCEIYAAPLLSEAAA